MNFYSRTTHCFALWLAFSTLDSPRVRVSCSCFVFVFRVRVCCVVFVVSWFCCCFCRVVSATSSRQSAQLRDKRGWSVIASIRCFICFICLFFSFRLSSAEHLATLHGSQSEAGSDRSELFSRRVHSRACKSAASRSAPWLGLAELPRGGLCRSGGVRPRRKRTPGSAGCYRDEKDAKSPWRPRAGAGSSVPNLELESLPATTRLRPPQATGETSHPRATFVRPRTAPVNRKNTKYGGENDQ